MGSDLQVIMIQKVEYLTSTYLINAMQAHIAKLEPAKSRLCIKAENPSAYQNFAPD